jgi:hypothetical protein
MLRFYLSAILKSFLPITAGACGELSPGEISEMRQFCMQRYINVEANFQPFEDTPGAII